MASEKEINSSSGSTATSSQSADLERNQVGSKPHADKDVVPEGNETATLESEREGAFINPFENESGETKYRTLTWLNAGFLLIAETISLGILSLPQVVASMGFVPGVILIVVFAFLSSYTGYVIYTVKLRYPGIHNFADAGQVFFGRWGKEILEMAQVILLVFIMGAHVLTFSVMMNVLTNHGTCTIIFSLVGMILSIILCLPRTMKKVAFMSIISCLSILCAVFITMVDVGVSPPKNAHAYAVTPSELTSFRAGVVGVSNILLAFTSIIAFFSFISEMRDPKEFPKSLAFLQTICVVFYITVGVVIYRYAGTDVAAPAIGSAGPLVSKIAYGIAIPTIVIAGVVIGHVATKNLWVRVWRNTNVMNEKSFRSYGSWVGITVVLWVIGWIIACAIPVFSQLLGLLGSLFCSWFVLGLPAMFWLMMNKGQWTKDWKTIVGTVVNICIFFFALAVCGLGVYGSAVEISQNSGSSSAFSCADNSS